MTQSKSVRCLTFAALFLALAMVLPFLTAQIPQIGAMLSPMHFPALLCGFLCGWPWGLAVGFLSPLLRSLLFGLPKLYPSAVAMAFECATYGAVAGIASRLLPRKLWATYLSLILAMIAGRVVWGTAQYVLLHLQGRVFTWELFVAGAFINAIPGIVLQIVAIPVLVTLLERRM